MSGQLFVTDAVFIEARSQHILEILTDKHKLTNKK